VGLSASVVPAEDAPDDVAEADEICIEFSPGPWLWLVVSRQVKQVLGFCFGDTFTQRVDRSRESLEAAWGDVPEGWRGRAVFTDRLATYAGFFPDGQHTACDKGSGLTSIVEALNTKWRQRQSGLARESCGVWEGILDDLHERFLILVGFSFLSR
jgi:IS1 family transposase